MPRIKTKPKKTTENKETTVSPGMIKEKKSLSNKRKETEKEEF